MFQKNQDKKSVKNKVERSMVCLLFSIWWLGKQKTSMPEELGRSPKEKRVRLSRIGKGNE